MRGQIVLWIKVFCKARWTGSISQEETHVHPKWWRGVSPNQSFWRLSHWTEVCWGLGKSKSLGRKCGGGTLDYGKGERNPVCLHHSMQEVVCIHYNHVHIYVLLHMYYLYIAMNISLKIWNDNAVHHLARSCDLYWLLYFILIFISILIIVLKMPYLFLSSIEYLF